MLSRAELESFPSLSYRARVAYSLSCLERAVVKFDLRGEAFEEWRERAWRRTSAPKEEWRAAPWPRNFAEIDELLDPPPGGWGEGVSDALRRMFDAAKECCESILAAPGAQAVVAALKSLVVELTKNGVHPPELARFERSPFAEMGGWGRTVPPGFFRDGVEREAFPAVLLTGLHSASRTRRREAAFAAGNLAMGSDQVEALLFDVMNRDDDFEATRLAEAALGRLGRMDLTAGRDRSYRSPEETSVCEARELVDRAERRRKVFDELSAQEAWRRASAVVEAENFHDTEIKRGAPARPG